VKKIKEKKEGGSEHPSAKQFLRWRKKEKEENGKREEEREKGKKR